jgi:adenosylmethionine-8-amino-7-oxononanoate aminotransferase
MSAVLQRSLSQRSPLALRGEGPMLVLADGRRIVDASGGAAVACIGHGDARVIQAMTHQAARLAYAHTGFFTSEPAEALAEKLVGHRPGGLSRALFVSSGSEAMEAALKLARQYFVERGEPGRVHAIARHQSYHGATLAALGVGGHRARRALYEALLPMHASHVSPCFAFHHRRADEDDAAYVARLALELDAEFQRVGPHRVMAFCAETVVGATTGCVAAVPGYFAAMRAVCERYGALLILDEVMCGLGRTGVPHAWEADGVAPDIQTIGKGLGGGYQPIGAVLVGERVVHALWRGSAAFSHGQTYQAHPVACAAALAVQTIVEAEGLIARSRDLGERLQTNLRAALSEHPHVADVRGRGLFVGVEFLADRAARRPFAASDGVAERVKNAALDAGVGVYPGSGTIDGVVGDHVLIAPPFNVPESFVDEIVDKFAKAVASAFERVSA